MRIAIACVSQETDTFSRVITEIDSFGQRSLYYGDDILEHTRGIGPLGGALEVLEGESDVEIVPIIMAKAGAGGPISWETILTFRDALVDGLSSQLPVDGMCFCQHGAATSTKLDDVEGFLLTEVRQVIGDSIPIVMPCDHHANITQQIVDRTDAIVGFRTQPHDQFETGYRAAEILMEIMRGKRTPTVSWRKIPLISHQEQFLTSGGPMKQWFDMARNLEKRDDVINVATFPMQPWLDVEEGGWSVVVTTDNDPELADSLARDVANEAWRLRDAFQVMSSVTVADAVRRAEAAPKGLIVLADTGDSVLGGAPGDSTVILREMLAQNIQSLALVPMYDAESAFAAFEAGVGSQVHLRLGGKADNVFSQPVEVDARVADLATGRIESSVTGMSSFDMGHTALLEIGSIRVVVSEHRGIGGTHPSVYRRHGIEPADAKMVVVKTASNFQYYADMTAEVIRADSAGTTQSHMENFQWKRLPRPIYPLDPMDDWSA